MASTSRNTVACVGCGVIGSGWAALFASRGLTVNVYDPLPGSESMLRTTVSRALAVLGSPGFDPMHKLHYTADLREAVTDVSFIQESAPESLEIKRNLYLKLDGLVHRSVPIASSTSDLPISLVQTGCTHPDRMVVGHPINPPYAVELVEVVGGTHTSSETIERTMDFYRSVGRSPIRLDEEVCGFLANRLQMALFREALQMIIHGQATIEQVDQVLIRGIGARWAAVGVFGAYILNSQKCSASDWLAHFEHIEFGKSLVHDGDFSEWTYELRHHLSRQWNSRIADTKIDSLMRERDQIVSGINNLHEVANNGCEK